MKSPSAMSNAELLEQASLSSTFVKAALVRSVFSGDVHIGSREANFGSTKMTQHYTADFKDPKNLEFIDRAFIPNIQKLLAEADKRDLKREMHQIFGVQALFAVQIGTVRRFSFDQITAIKFPQPQERVAAEPMGQIIAFPNARQG